MRFARYFSGSCSLSNERKNSSMPAESHAASSELRIVREYTAAATQPVAVWSTTPMRREEDIATKRHKSSGNHLYPLCFFVAILLLRQSRVTPVRDTKRQSVFQWSRLPRRHKLSQSSNISPPAHRIILTQIALTAYLFLG